MTNPQKLPKLSVQDYLSFEESAQVRHEFVDGRIFAMTGASRPHNIISLNITMALRSKLAAKGCNVFVSDVKVRVEATNCFYYPDVLVECDAADKESDNESVYTETPVTIFEVLSKSTASIDRREKMIAYQHLASLTQYIIVHQTRKRLEVYQRVGDDWTFQEIGSAETLIVGSCQDAPIAISMDDLYAGIKFKGGPDLHVREDEEVYTW